MELPQGTPPSSFQEGVKPHLINKRLPAVTIWDSLVGVCALSCLLHFRGWKWSKNNLVFFKKDKEIDLGCGLVLSNSVVKESEQDK